MADEPIAALESIYVDLFQKMLPHAFERVAHIKKERTRFVHYTSAASAMTILQTGSIILRNASVMNDYSEVQHGMECLFQAYNGADGDRLKAVMAKVQEDLPDIFADDFNASKNKLQYDTYIFSMSEHGDGFEDQFGRLSMWRAYGANNGVAFVFNNTPFTSESTALGAFSTPVLYCTPDQYSEIFRVIVDHIEMASEELQLIGGHGLYSLLSNAFRFSVQSIKHPSFHEERENGE